MSEEQKIPKPERDIIRYLVRGESAKRPEFSTLEIKTTNAHSKYRTEISGTLKNAPVSLQMKTEEISSLEGYSLFMRGTIGKHHVWEHYNALEVPNFIENLD